MTQVFRRPPKKKKNTSLWIFCGTLVALFIISTLHGGIGGNTMMRLSDFMSASQNGQIEKVSVLNETVVGQLKDGTNFKSFFPEMYIPRILDTLNQNKVQYDFMPIDGQKTLFDRLFALFLGLLGWLPMILITLYFLWPIIQMKRRNKKGEVMDLECLAILSHLEKVRQKQ